MTKLEFLRRLEKRLSILEEEERREILGFYYERFVNNDNKTDAEIVKELGSIDTIVENILSGYGYEKELIRKKSENFLVKFGAILFDLIIGIWILVALLSAALFFSSGLFLTLATPVIFFQYNLRDSLILFPSAVGLFVLFILLGILLFELFFIVLKNLLIWHVNIFKPTKKEEFSKKASKLTILPILKKFNFSKKRFLQLIVICVLLFSIRYVSELFIAKNEVSDNTYTYKKEYLKKLSNNTEWNIAFNGVDTGIEFRKTKSDSVKIIRYYDSEYNKIDINSDKINNCLKIDCDGNGIKLFKEFNFKFFDLNSFKQNLIVEIPNNLSVNNIEVNSVNGIFKISNFEINNLIIDMGNSPLNINGIKAKKDIKIYGSNNDITASELKSNNITIKTRNAKIKLSKSNANSIITKTINDDILISEVNSKSISSITINSLIEYRNVYTSSAILKTRNDNIIYLNDKKNTVLDKLETYTMNGDVIKNVSVHK